MYIYSDVKRTIVSKLQRIVA